MEGIQHFLREETPFTKKLEGGNKYFEQVKQICLEGRRGGRGEGGRKEGGREDQREAWN